MASHPDDHEVSEDRPGAHSHDHSHADRQVATAPHAGHVHWHLPLDDHETDTKLNGHTPA